MIPCGVGGGRPEDEEYEITITFDQMRRLLQDPWFLRCEPKTAALFRQILSEVDSG